MNILIKPIVTEKMTAQGEDFNRYGFVVEKSANKLQIKQAVEELTRNDDAHWQTRRAEYAVPGDVGHDSGEDHPAETHFCQHEPQQPYDEQLGKLPYCHRRTDVRIRQADLT